MSSETHNHQNRNGGRTLFSAGAGLLLLAWLMVPVAPVQPDCELSFQPAQVEAGSESAVVQAIPSEEIDGVDAVQAERGSGLAVNLDPDRPLHLHVDATDASEGQWAVTLSFDGQPVCTGSLGVTAPGI